MKPILLLVSTLILLVQTQAQEVPHKLQPNPIMDIGKKDQPIKGSSEYFLQKSKKLKTAGCVFLAAGAVIGVIGLIVYENHIHTDYSFDQFDEAVMGTAGAEFAFIAGTAMVVTSIPLFIASGHYKKKALNLSAALKIEPYQEISQTTMSLKRYPAVSLTVHF